MFGKRHGQFCVGSHSSKRPRNSPDGRKGIVDLMAQDANQTLLREPFLCPQGFRSFRQDNQTMRLTTLPEAGAPNNPAPLRTRIQARNHLPWRSFDQILDFQLLCRAMKNLLLFFSQKPHACAVDNLQPIIGGKSKNDCSCFRHHFAKKFEVLKVPKAFLGKAARNLFISSAKSPKASPATALVARKE